MSGIKNSGDYIRKMLIDGVIIKPINDRNSTQIILKEIAELGNKVNQINKLALKNNEISKQEYEKVYQALNTAIVEIKKDFISKERWCRKWQ